MAARRLRIMAWVMAVLLLLPILIVVLLAIQPKWVEQPAEIMLRNYLESNPLADSAELEFNSISWIPFRGVVVRGLNLHRNDEGVFLKELQIEGIGWRNGGFAAEFVKLDSLVVTGTPSAKWMNWFEPWVDPLDTTSSELHATVDRAEVQFWVRSIEGDTVLGSSVLSATDLKITSDGLSVDANLTLAAPGGPGVHVLAKIDPSQSEVQVQYESYQLGLHYQPDKIELKLEDNSINSIDLNILNINDSWVIKPSEIVWDGRSGVLDAEWGGEVHRLNLQWSGIRARIQEQQDSWSLKVNADSAEFDGNAPWTIHGTLHGTYAEGKWYLMSPNLNVRVERERLRLRPLKVSGTANSWQLDVDEASYGHLVARGDYGGTAVYGSWAARQPLKFFEGIPALAFIDGTWSSTSPWDIQLALRDSSSVVGRATAIATKSAWDISATFGAYRLNASFDRTPNDWVIPAHGLSVWAEQLVSQQLDVLDSVGLRRLNLQGPEFEARLHHLSGRTTAMARVANGGISVSWRYTATPNLAEHVLDVQGSERAQLHLRGGRRDSLRVSVSGHADHPRGGAAEVELAVWPHRSVWWGRLVSGSAEAWYRPEDGLPLELKGNLTGGQALTYDFDAHRFAIPDPIQWTSPEGGIAFGGVLSPDEGEVLRVQARGVNLPFWSRVAGLSGVDLGGSARLDAVVVGQLNGWAVSGGIQTENLSIQKQEAGVLTLDLDYAPDADRTALAVHWEHRDTVLLNLLGSLDAQRFSAQTDVLNLPVRWARPFTEGTVDGLNGRIKGSVRLDSRADFSNLTWSGSGFWSNAALKLPSVGLGLRSSTPWTLKSRELVLGPARWADHRGVGSAEIRAKVSFTGSELVDLTFQTEKMLVLDLPPNPDFYGYVVGSGQGRLRGTASALRLDVKAKSSDSSVFVMPLDAPVSLDEVEFLHFKSRTTPDAPRVRVRNAEDFRFDLHLDLDVTPDVLARLILDETVGDVIEARGAGSLQLDVPWVGDMALRGNLALNRGTYLFTLQNLINKPFSLLPGGTLNWTGDPYAAQMDLTAVYKTRVDVRDYLALPEAGRQNVDVEMHATGPLFQPQLAFGIRLPNAGELAQAALQSRLSYPDERTTQVLSLLTISSFWVGSSPLAAQGMQAVESNTTQVLASQFTNFVTQGLGADWDVNLAYSTNTAAAQREMEASIGRSFLDDRLSIQTEWGIPIGQSQPAIGLGDVEVRYQLSEDGRWSAKAYQRRNDRNMQSGIVGSQRQGVGIRWEQSGASWKDVLRAKN